MIRIKSKSGIRAGLNGERYCLDMLKFFNQSIYPVFDKIFHAGPLHDFPKKEINPSNKRTMA